MNSAAAILNLSLFIHHQQPSRLLLLCLLVIIIPPAQLSAMEPASSQGQHSSPEKLETQSASTMPGLGQRSDSLFRSTPRVRNNHHNNEQPSLQQFDAPASEIILHLQILVMAPVRSLAYKQILPGGWRLLTHHSNELLAIARQKIDMHSHSDTHIEAGNIRPIRTEIRHWLAHYIPDTPDLALCPLTAGFELRFRWHGSKRIHLRLKPWLRYQSPSQIMAPATIEILPELGMTDAPGQPPSSVAPMRLNIHPTGTTSTVHFVEINKASTEVYLDVGQEIELLAYEREARSLGNAILSRIPNSQKKFMILRLSFE